MEYEIENAQYNEFGGIDMDWNHPRLGWIPFTANEDDPEEHGQALFAQASAIEGGPDPYVAPPPDPDPDPTAADVDRERDRLISVFTYNINGTDYEFQMDEASQGLVTASGAAAKFALGAGATAGNLRWSNPDRDFAWWDSNNVRHEMDALEMSAFADAAMLHVADIRFAARTIKDVPLIPNDIPGAFAAILNP